MVNSRKNVQPLTIKINWGLHVCSSSCSAGCETAHVRVTWYFQLAASPRLAWVVTFFSGRRWTLFSQFILQRSAVTLHKAVAQGHCCPECYVKTAITLLSFKLNSILTRWSGFIIPEEKVQAFIFFSFSPIQSRQKSTSVIEDKLYSAHAW